MQQAAITNATGSDDKSDKVAMINATGCNDKSDKLQ